MSSRAWRYSGLGVVLLIDGQSFRACSPLPLGGGSGFRSSLWVKMARFRRYRPTCCCPGGTLLLFIEVFQIGLIDAVVVIIAIIGIGLKAKPPTPTLSNIFGNIHAAAHEGDKRLGSRPDSF